jgi:hypothetical protein
MQPLSLFKGKLCLIIVNCLGLLFKMIVVENNMDNLPFKNFFFINFEAFFLWLLFFLNFFILKDIKRSIVIGILSVVDFKHFSIMGFQYLLLEVWEWTAIIRDTIEDEFGTLCVSLFMLVISIIYIECFDRFMPFFARIYNNRVPLIVWSVWFFFRCIFIKTVILNRILK